MQGVSRAGSPGGHGGHGLGAGRRGHRGGPRNPVAITPAAVVVAALVATLAALAIGCGDEQARVGDGRIIEALDLRELDSGYAIDGDPFCSVAGELLNDADEVDTAREGEGVLITSRAGNVGIEGVPPFGRNCQRKARRELNRLDPVESG